MHRHDDRAEIVFIREGLGAHIIGGREYRTRGGDVLVYNSGTLHDESAQPEVGISAYCCGFRGLKLKGLPVNHLVPEQGCPVLASGEHRAAFESLFELLYDQVGEAQSLLINTELSVAEVAERVGYRHASYFNTAFRKVVGVTPGGYRKCYLSG